MAPADASVYVEVAVKPEGELKSNIEALAENVTGIDDLGTLIVDKLEEEAADSDEPIDFETEVENWLGQKGGIFLGAYDGDNFDEVGFAIETTDVDATQQFIDKHVTADEGGKLEENSYEGVDFKVESEDGEAVGIIGDLFVFGEDEAAFKAAVDASKGESLSESDDFQKALDGAPGNSFASVYADVGALIEEAGQGIDSETQQFLDTVGINAKEMTLTTSLVPGSDHIELDLSSDFGGLETPVGDASALLGEMPERAIAAFASADFGKALGAGIDEIDAQGIPGEVPPHELKKALAAVGIDLDKLSDSLQDAAVFVEGTNRANLGGAVVFTAKGGEANKTVASIGSFLRLAKVPGVTAIKGDAAGFSIRSPELGRKPVVVAARGDRIAIAYGPQAAAQALQRENAKTLSDAATYKAAVASLGNIPITGFADGAGLLKLIGSTISREHKSEFMFAKPYLRKARFLAVGAGRSGELTTAKLILGFNE